MTFDHPMVRWPDLIPSQKLHKRVGDFGASVVGNARGRAFDVLHEPVKIIARVRYTDHSDGNPIPEQAGVEFGDRNVERGAETVFNAARNLALVFKRVRRFDAKLEGEESDHEQFIT